ncbi:DUF4159 domain-containing protein [Candidatus Poribacteria bacterium]|nr:DUF4159 domain-containing protein [Candidatus Poribacteria bacterium]
MKSKIYLAHEKKRIRRYAILISIGIHGIALLLISVSLLKPILQYQENKIYAEIIDSLPKNRIRKDLPKPKPIHIVERNPLTSGVKGITNSSRNPLTPNPIDSIDVDSTLDAPTMMENVTRLAPTPQSMLEHSRIDGPSLSTGTDTAEDGEIPSSGKGGTSTDLTIRNKGSSGFGNFTKGTGSGSGYADLDEGFGKLPTLKDEIGEKLGGIIKGTGADIKAHIRIIRLKHSLSDWWQDPTAIPSLIKWLKENTTSIRADMSYAGGALPLTDKKILDAPLIIMTGHDKNMTVNRRLMRDGQKITSGFSDDERVALRKYVLERGGTLFFDDCGFKASFANLIKQELRMIFPEYTLEKLPFEHEIYRIYYNLKKPPEGGDRFWENENVPQPSKFKFHWGIYVPRNPGAKKQPNLTYKDSQGTLKTTNRLGVIFNRKDYLCAMETAEIESRTALRLRRSTDVYRFMTNLMIYTLKYGGNTDRSEYTE